MRTAGLTSLPIAKGHSLQRLDFQPKPDARYRTIPESSIIEMLLLVSWAYEVDAGDRRVAQLAASEALDVMGR